MIDLDKTLDAMFARLKDSIKAEIRRELSFNETLLDQANQRRWSDKFFHGVWAEMKARGTTPIWLLYVFMAAVQTGDIKPEISIYPNSEDNADEEPQARMDDPPNCVDAEGDTVHGMAHADVTLPGGDWSISADFTAVT